MKFDLMQNIIHEKSGQVDKLEREIRQFMHQNEELKAITMQHLQQAEQFEKVKTIIQDKDW